MLALNGRAFVRSVDTGNPADCRDEGLLLNDHLPRHIAAVDRAVILDGACRSERPVEGPLVLLRRGRTAAVIEHDLVRDAAAPIAITAGRVRARGPLPGHGLAGLDGDVRRVEARVHERDCVRIVVVVAVSRLLLPGPVVVVSPPPPPHAAATTMPIAASESPHIRMLLSPPMAGHLAAGTLGTDGGPYSRRGAC